MTQSPREDSPQRAHRILGGRSLGSFPRYIARTSIILTIMTGDMVQSQEKVARNTLL